MRPVKRVHVLSPVRDAVHRDMVPRFIVVVFRVDRVAKKLVANHLKQDECETLPV